MRKVDPPSWSTARDLLNQRPRPPQRRPFTDSLVPLRWPFIQALVRRNRSASPKALYNAPAEAFVHCTGPAPRTPYSTPPALLYRRCSLIRLFQFVLLRFFSLSCNCSLTTDELSCMSTGAATVAPEPLQQRQQLAQT